MNEKNHSFNSIEKKVFLALFQRMKIISEFKSKETQSLAELRNKQNAHRSLFSIPLINKILWLCQKNLFYNYLYLFQSKHHI